MRKEIKNGLSALILVLVLFACNNKEPERNAPAPGSPPKVASAPGSPAKASIEAQIQSAEHAFETAQYDKAVSLTRNILAQKPDDQTLWSLYDRALLARSGDDYLRTLPPDRYRVDIPIFFKNSRKGSGNYFILDVREPQEFDEGHLEGSVNVPLRRVLQNLNVLPGPKSGKVLLVVCNTQHRANHVIVLLRELGYDNAFTLHGGYKAYVDWLKKNHLPLKDIKKTRNIVPSSKSPGKMPETEEDFGC